MAFAQINDEVNEALNNETLLESEIDERIANW